MPRIQADDGKAESFAGMIEPGRQRTGLQSNADQIGGIAPKRRGQHFGITGPLAAPDRSTRLVDNVDRSFVVLRYSETSKAASWDMRVLRLRR